MMMKRDGMLMIRTDETLMMETGVEKGDKGSLFDMFHGSSLPLAFIFAFLICPRYPYTLLLSRAVTCISFVSQDWES